MMLKLKLVLVPIVCLPFAGCAGTTTPVVAGAVDHVGVVAGASPQMQGGGLSVGYRGAKFAIVPVESQNGEVLSIKDSSGRNTYSVFTQLGVDARGANGTNGAAVMIEQVVAVGPAADKWLTNQNASASPLIQTPTPAPAPPGQP